MSILDPCPPRNVLVVNSKERMEDVSRPHDPGNDSKGPQNLP